MSANFGRIAFVAFALLLAAPVAAQDAASSLWERISDSGDPALFEDFATRFPNNVLAKIAQLRIAALNGVDMSATIDRVAPSLPTVRDWSAPEQNPPLAELPSYDEIVAHLPSSRALQKANVRSGPSTNDAVVGSLGAGDAVAILGTEGDWLKISYAGGIAYVASRLIGEGGTTLDAGSFRGLMSPVFAAGAGVAPEPRSDCLARPTIACLRAMLDETFAERVAANADYLGTYFGLVAATFFKLGDQAAGWHYFDAGVAYGASREASDSYSAATNRARELTLFCGALVDEQPRLALAACSLALPHAREAADNDDYNSPAYWRADALDDIAAALVRSSYLQAPAEAVFREAAAQVPEMIGGTLYEGEEEQADFYENLVSQMPTSARKLAAIETALRVAFAMPVLDRSGSPDTDRLSNIYWLAHALADLGFLDEAWELANVLPTEGTYPDSEIKGFVTLEAFKVDLDLGKRLFERLVQMPGGSFGAATALRAQMGVGNWELVDQLLPALALDDATLSELAQGYSENGKLEEALSYGARITDSSRQETVGREMVEDLAAFNRLDEYNKVAAIFPGVTEETLRSYISYGVDRSYNTILNKLLADNDPDAALDYLANQAEAPAYLIDNLIAHEAVRDDARLLARAVAVAKPDSKVAALLALMKVL